MDSLRLNWVDSVKMNEFIDRKTVESGNDLNSLPILYSIARDSAFLQTIYIYIYIAKVGLTFLHIKTKISSIASITEKDEKSTEIPISHQ